MIRYLYSGHSSANLFYPRHAYENALAERLNGILKPEWSAHEQYAGFEQANGHICRITEIYNTPVPHLNCDMLTAGAGAYKSRKKQKKMETKKYNSEKVTLENTGVNRSWGLLLCL